MTTPDRWERVPVDLAPLAGQDVMLSLGLAASDDGVIGLWGSPVVRSRVPSRVGVPTTPHGVILIMADTIRPDHLGAYGYTRDTTPVLGRLASGGARFDDVVAQATWTKVSTPSILTSLYPLTHTVTDVPDRLPSSATTMAEIYRDAGYATLSFSSVTFSGGRHEPAPGVRELHEAASSRTGPQPGQVGARVRRPAAALARPPSQRAVLRLPARVRSHSRSSHALRTTRCGPTRPTAPRTRTGSPRSAGTSTARSCGDR